MDPIMEEVIQLRCRNTALETELRLVREQLVQAQASTSYLITALSMQQNGQQSAEVIRMQAQLDAMSAENSHIKATLTINRRRHPDFEPPFQRTITAQDLYEGQQGQSDPVQDTLNSTPLESPKSDQQPSLVPRPDDLLSFDQCSLPSTTRDIKEDVSPSFDEDVQRIIHSDGSTSFVFNTEPSDPFEILSDSESPLQLASSLALIPGPPAPLTSGPREAQEELLPLAPWQHKLLLNNCCFLEDMDEAERDEKFEQFAKERGRSAGAWKQYFEETVWPEYVAKKQKLEAETSNMSADVVASGDESMAESTLNVSDGETLDMVESCKETELQDGSVVASRSTTDPEDAPAALNGVNGLRASRWAPQPHVAQVLDEGTKEAELNINNVTADGDEDHADSAKKAAPDNDQVIGQMQDMSITAPQQPVTEESATPSATGSRPLRAGLRGDMRPSCCRFPQEVEQLFHSNHEHDPATPRTVQLSNLPSDITLAKILEKVKGGKIYSASYVETSKLKVKPLIRTDMVFVTFVDAKAATSFVDDAAKNWICYYFEKWDQPIKATVSLIQAPARQISHRELDSINRYNHTRVLYIVDRNTLSPTKAEDLLMDFDTGKNGMNVLKRAIKTGRNERGAVVLEYASIIDAVNARSAVGVMHWEFGGMEAGFLPDPCDTSVPSPAGGDGQKIEPRVALLDAGETSRIHPSPALGVSASHYTTDSLHTTPSLQHTTPRLAAQVPRINPWAASGDLEFAKEMAGSFKTNYARAGAVLPPHARTKPRLLPDHMMKSAAVEREEEIMRMEN